MFVVCFLLVSSVFGGLWEVELSFWNFVLVGVFWTFHMRDILISIMIPLCKFQGFEIWW